MVPVNPNNISLEKESTEGLSSLLRQGGVVFVGFVAMLVLTGGAPSGFAVGLTVCLSGIFVAWSEQRRLTHRNKMARQIQDYSVSQELLTSFQFFSASVGKVSPQVVEDRLFGVLREVSETTDVEDMAQAVTLAEESLPKNTLSAPLMSSKDEILSWLIQLKDEDISPNKKAILWKKFNTLSQSINVSEEHNQIVAITNSEDDFFALASIAGLHPKVDFQKADLRFVNLHMANLMGANLYRADLSGASLSGARLSGARLNGARLIDAKLICTNLSGANLSGANLYKAFLHGANLSRADLLHANLREANLHGANLCETNLYRADLSGADLSEANLSGADLSGASLSKANVRNARFFRNNGISSELKQNLQNRGAIFEDSPGDRGKVRIPH